MSSPAMVHPTAPNARIRVLINGLHARSGGGVTYLRNILPSLAEDPELELHLFLHSEQFDLVENLDDRIRVHLFDFKPGIAYLLIWEQFCLPILARLMAVDITFSPANYGPLLAPGTIILLRNALSVGGRETRPFKRLYWLALSLMTLVSLACSRHAVAVSRFALKTLTFGFDRILRDRLSVIYHGVSPIYFPGSKRRSESSFLLAVADIYIQKNLHTLLDAMPAILREFPDLTLIIAGSKIDHGYYDELIGLIETLGLQSKVRFIDSVPPATLVELYRNCTVFVFPSTVETFGNPLVEAMACGSPIACSTTAAMPEIVEGCAEFFNPFVSASIADAVLRLLRDPHRRQELESLGIARARRFSWKENAQQLAGVIRLAASQKPPRGNAPA
jgi:glycosyltransferase involved in cell wall biosynthesis